jgi:hypothetical protein
VDLTRLIPLFTHRQLSIARLSLILQRLRQNARRGEEAKKYDIASF